MRRLPLLLAATVALAGCSSMQVATPVSDPPTTTITTTPKPTKTPKPSASKTTAPIKTKSDPLAPVSSLPPKNKDDKKQIALTFDDGPSVFTPQIVSILEDKDVKATFFTLGVQVDVYPRYAKQAHDAGMSVQAHSDKHINYATSSSAVRARDLAASTSKVKDATGQAPTCLRPPYGARSAASDAFVKRSGLRTVTWDIDPQDWDGRGAQAITKGAVSAAHPGGIILLHDGGGDRSATVQALPGIIDALKKQGYTFTLAC